MAASECISHHTQHTDAFRWQKAVPRRLHLPKPMVLCSPLRKLLQKLPRMWSHRKPKDHPRAATTGLRAVGRAPNALQRQKPAWMGKQCPFKWPPMQRGTRPTLSGVSLLCKRRTSSNAEHSAHALVQTTLVHAYVLTLSGMALWVSQSLLQLPLLLLCLFLSVLSSRSASAATAVAALLISLCLASPLFLLLLLLLSGAYLPCCFWALSHC